MRLAELLQQGAAELANAGVTEFELDARLLLEHCLGLSRSEIFLSARMEVEEAGRQRFFELLERRRKREPLAYILGEREFWSLPFVVTPAVLIPRPETEFLLDRALALASPANIDRGLLLDLCCGSGIIAAVLARETGQAVIASDLSSAALEVARVNLRRHGLDGRVHLVQGDLLAPFRQDAGVFSLVVANPPYVGRQSIDRELEPEVADHEPLMALDGGEDGLALIREIRRQLPRVLHPGGEFFMEMGADQGEAVLRMFSEEYEAVPAFVKVEILVDYAGRDRVLHAQWA